MHHHQRLPGGHDGVGEGLPVFGGRVGLTGADVALHQVVAVAFAYFKTSFLTVRGRVYALNPNRRRPVSPQPSDLEP